MSDDATVQVKPYLTIFGALLVLTAATVGVSYLHLPKGPAIALGLVIAGAKATMVALFFMHLKHERRLVYWTLGLTAVLCVVLFGITLWTEGDHAPGSRFRPAFEEGVR